MLRFMLVLVNAFNLCWCPSLSPSLEVAVAIPHDLPPRPAPLRRSPAITRYTTEDELLQWPIKNQLEYLAGHYGIPGYGISEQSIVELVRANPGDSNPYFRTYNAYLITLACRRGLIAAVMAIVEENPNSLDCINGDSACRALSIRRNAHYGHLYTPLDEARAFSKPAVADYLRSQGASTFQELLNSGS